MKRVPRDATHALARQATIAMATVAVAAVPPSVGVATRPRVTIRITKRSVIGVQRRREGVAEKTIAIVRGPDIRTTNVIPRLDAAVAMTTKKTNTTPTVTAGLPGGHRHGDASADRLVRDPDRRNLTAPVENTAIRTSHRLGVGRRERRRRRKRNTNVIRETRTAMLRSLRKR